MQYRYIYNKYNYSHTLYHKSNKGNSTILNKSHNSPILKMETTTTLVLKNCSLDKNTQNKTNTKKKTKEKRKDKQRHKQYITFHINLWELSRWR